MIPVSATDHPGIEFNPEVGEESKKVKAPAGKIAWLHSLADAPGASFDIVIKDGLGREKFRKMGCHSNSERFGELLNVPTMLGEDLEITIENLTGSKTLKLFLN